MLGDWTRSLDRDVRVYAVRRAAIGGVPKIAVLFDGAEADFVIIPARSLGLLKRAVGLRLYRHSAWLRRRMQELAIVVRPGWKFLKGAEHWEPFYRRVVAEVPDPRLNDREVCNLADSFVCDFVWTQQKIVRGELLAAQRMIHQSLVETNFRLLHELRLRHSERTFPEARRAERVLRVDELDALRISAVCADDSLRKAAEHAAKSCREIVFALVGESWKWPV